MQRADAAAILNVSPSASTDEAVRAYQGLITEYQIRLTNAPTTTLKNLYQARLRELEDAKDAFVGGASDGLSDLPTDQPSLVAPEAPPAPPRAESPPGAAPPYAQQSRPATATDRSGEPAKSPPATGPQPLAEPQAVRQQSRSRYVVVAVPVFGLLALGYYLSLGRGNDSEANGTSAAGATVSDSSFRESTLSVIEHLAIGRIQLKHGDYRAAMDDVTVATDTLALLSTVRPADTTVARLTREKTTFVERVRTACAAERRVAERTGGERPECSF